MATIKKVELNPGQKIINPFKTSRNSTTNPFKYQDFEGNTLDVSLCADIFEDSTKKANKLRLIASSVMGSVTKLHNRLTEPIINFVKRVGSDISASWARTKEVLDKDIVDIGKDIGHSISDSVAGVGKSIHDKLPTINLTDLGKNIYDKYLAAIEKIHTKKISKDTPVAELRIMLEKELAAMKEAA